MKKAIIILLLVVVVAGISGGTVYFVMNKESEDKSSFTKNIEEDKHQEENTTPITNTNTTKNYKYVFSTNGNAILESTTSMGTSGQCKIRCQYCGNITDNYNYKRFSFPIDGNFPQTKQLSDFCYNCNRTTTAEITCQRIEK